MTKNFTTVISYTEKKQLGLQRNLIFNQGIKNIWVFEMVVVGPGGGGERKQKIVRTSGKILATPLIRTQMIDWFVIPVGIQSRRIPYQSYSWSKR